VHHLLVDGCSADDIPTNQSINETKIRTRTRNVLLYCVEFFTAAWFFTGLYPLLMHADAILVNQTTARTVWLLAV
jgi:hypothetical protein